MVTTLQVIKLWSLFCHFLSNVSLFLQQEADFFLKKRKQIFMMIKSICCSREEERCKMALELKRFKKELQQKKTADLII